MKFTDSQITSAAALRSYAKEHGVTLTEEEAERYFAEMHKTGELSDDELDMVAGGGVDLKETTGLQEDRFNKHDPYTDGLTKYDINDQNPICPRCGSALKVPIPAGTCKDQNGAEYNVAYCQGTCPKDGNRNTYRHYFCGLWTSNYYSW